MPELFRLEKEEFSKIDDEYQWTYQCLIQFTFNYRDIRKITITDHPWRKKGREWMTKELVLNILREYLSGEIKRPKKRHGKREVFIEENALMEIKIIYWFFDLKTIVQIDYGWGTVIQLIKIINICQR